MKSIGYAGPMIQDLTGTYASGAGRNLTCSFQTKVGLLTMIL